MLPAVAAALIGFFTLTPRGDRPMPVTVAPRSGGGFWVITPHGGFEATIDKGKATPTPAARAAAPPDTFLGPLRVTALQPATPKKVMPQLAGKIVFRGASDDAVGTIVIDDGVFVRATLGAKPCIAGVLLREPTAKVTESDGFARADFLFIGTKPQLPCDGPPPKAFKVEDMHAGLRITFDHDARPVGVQLVGYMFSMTFLREGETDPALLKRLGQENQEEIGHQAE